MAIRRPMKGKRRLEKPRGGSFSKGGGVLSPDTVKALAQDRERYRREHPAEFVERRLMDDAQADAFLRSLELEKMFGSKMIASGVWEAVSGYMLGPAHLKFNGTLLTKHLTEILGSAEVADVFFTELTERLAEFNRRRSSE